MAWAWAYDYFQQVLHLLPWTLKLFINLSLWKLISDDYNAGVYYVGSQNTSDRLSSVEQIVSIKK